MTSKYELALVLNGALEEDAKAAAQETAENAVNKTEEAAQAAVNKAAEKANAAVEITDGMSVKVNK